MKLLGGPSTHARYNVLPTLAWSLTVAIIQWLPDNSASASIFPEWDDQIPTVVELPEEGGAMIDAAGVLTLGSLDVMLVVDISGSMADETAMEAPGGGTQRGDWARDGSLAFVDQLPDEARLGLAQFYGSANLLLDVDTLGIHAPASDHRMAIQAAISSLPRNGNGTNIAAGINLASSVLTGLPTLSDSQHIVLVTDGDATTGNAISATQNAIASGIASVNMVGLPGANRDALDRIAAEGHGKFVDGSNLNTLIAEVSQIISESETLQELELILPSGEIITDIPVDPLKRFVLQLPILEGDNLFVIRATSNLGNIKSADLHVLGIAAVVPEPSGCELVLVVLGCGMLWIKSRRVAPHCGPRDSMT